MSHGLAIDLRTQRRSPELVRVGPSVLLVRTDVIARWLGMVDLQEIHAWLKRLRVPILSTRNGSYVARHALETVLFCLLDLGGPGASEVPDGIADKYLAPLDNPNHPMHVRMAMTGVACAHLEREEVERTLHDWGKMLLKAEKERTLKHGSADSTTRTRGRRPRK